MSYFDDPVFCDADASTHCTAVLDTRFPDTYSIEYLHTGRMFFGLDGGPCTVLERPVVFWHHPQHTYQYGAVDEQGWHHHWVLMSGDRARCLLEEGFMLLSDMGYYFVRDVRTVLSLFGQLIVLTHEADVRRQAERVLLTENLLLALMREKQEQGVRIIHGAGLEQVASRIDDEPFADVDFQDEARGLGLSYSRFRGLFKSKFGVAPHDYVLTRRMRAAAALLRTQENTVEGIAFRLGYQDPAQFSRLFKKKIGLPPSTYRHAMRLVAGAFRPY